MLFLRRYLHFFCNEIAFQTARTNFKRACRAVNFSLYFYQIGAPRTAGMVFGVTYLVAGYRMFSTNITNASHSILPFKQSYSEDV